MGVFRVLFGRPGGGGLPLLCSSFGASIDIHEFVKLQVDRRNGKNCPDLRNTRVIDLGREFSDYGAVADIHDPCADRELAAREYGVELMAQPQTGACGAINIAVRMMSPARRASMACAGWAMAVR